MNKKIGFVLIYFCMFMFIVLSSGTSVQAINVDEGEILTMGGHTIKKDTKIDEIENLYGEPKIISDNAFGGNSYTFFDDNYTWYLHVEMNEAGDIRGIGCISDDFESAKFKAGQDKSYSYSLLGGAGVEGYRTGKLIAFYSPINANYSEREEYFSRLKTNEAHYIYELQAPSVYASKVYAQKRGKTFEQEAMPLELFDYVEKLHDNNVSVWNYAQASAKTSSIQLIGSGLIEFYECLPNPITLAERTQAYSANSGTFKYILYELGLFDYDNSYYRATDGLFFVDPSFITERKKVELNQEEKDKLKKVSEAYEKYITLAKETEQINAFDITPQYTTYPLTAGKLNLKHLQVSTDFLNVIRAGIGLDGYEYDEDMANSAQYKAALNTYLNNYYDGDDKQSSYSHQYDKPEGIDQNFYDTAMKYYNENLYMGNHLTGIIYALDDTYDTPYCGHRQSLLYPYFTKWGIGWVGSGLSINMQSCQKFGGHRDSDIEIVAWPANGITLIDALVTTTPYWTCDLYNGPYDFSTIDKVVVKNLSTEQEYNITNFTKSSNFVGFSGSSITYEDGDVFEVIFKNVTNTNTHAMQDYSYRSVFRKFSGSTSVDGEELNVPESVTISIGEELKLPVTLESSSNNKLLRFKSSSDEIVKVRQNGVITGVSRGFATIDVTSALGSEKVIQVNVVDFIKGDINEDKIVNSTDAAIVLDKYKNDNATTKDYNIADMNEDGILNSTDAAMILDIYKAS